jgi:hypothetical protein
MANTKPTESVEVTVSRHDAEITNMAKSIGDLSDNVNEGFGAINKKLDSIQRPNYLVMLTLLTLILAFLMAALDLVTSPMKTSIASVQQQQKDDRVQMEADLLKETASLDVTLQREYKLSEEKIDDKLAVVDQAARDRDAAQSKAMDAMGHRQDILWEIQYDQIKRDQDELAKWRNGELKKP